MKKYISSYMEIVEKYISDELKNATAASKESFLRELEIKIQYFQHERLIHLIVTVLFALMEIMSVLALSVSGSLPALILSVMFLVLLIPYVMHYYFLENSVQKFYKLRDKIRETI